MNDLEKDFVKYPEALGLKELGFDEYCMGCCYYEWKDRGVTHILLHTPDSYDSHSGVKAPTYSQSFRWFREKYKLGAIVAQFGWGIENEFGQIIHNITSGETVLCYEEAERACLKKLIEIVKEKQK